MKGINGDPLEYKVCTGDEPKQVGIVYATEHESIGVTTPLE
jgi:hypothetical protein